MSYLDRARERLADVLAPGEHVVAAARTQTKGMAGGMAAFGAVGAAVQTARSSGDRSAAAEAGIKLPGRSVLVVTDRRVFFSKQSAMLARPKGVAVEIPAGVLRHAEATGKGFGAWKRIRLDWTSGGSSEVDVAGRDGLEQVVGAINALAARRLRGGRHRDGEVIELPRAPNVSCKGAGPS